MQGFKSQLEYLIPRIVAAQGIARAIIDGRKAQQQLGRPKMAGGKFFALVDEIKQSEARLDEMAEPLLKRLAETEERAKRAVEARHTRLDAAADFLARLEGHVDALEAANAVSNGGPILGGSEPSSN